MRWLADLNAQTSLCVAQPVKTLDDSWLAMATVEGVADLLPTVLLTWVEGDSRKAEDLTTTDVERIGAFLSEASYSSLQPIRRHPDFARPRLDWEGLFGAQSPYDPGKGTSIFQPDQIAVMDAVANRVREVMAALHQDADTFGLIHGDFITKNTLFQDDQVCALDFEYCGFGYYLYDLAPVLLGLSPLTQYATLKDALWHGLHGAAPAAQCLSRLSGNICRRAACSVMPLDRQQSG